MRFSLKTLLAATTLVAATCAAALYPNAIWAASFTTGAFLLLLFAVVAAMLRRGRARAFWIGFAVFGIGYFTIATFGERETDSGQRIGGMGIRMSPLFAISNPQLATTQFLVWANKAIQPLRHERYQTEDPFSRRGGNAGGPPIMTGTARSFLRIGHADFTLLFALVGGLIGNWMYEPALPKDQGTTSR